MPILELVTFHGHMKDGEIGPFTGNVLFRLTDNADVPVASERLARLTLFKEQYEANYLECFAGGHAAVLRKKDAKALLVSHWPVGTVSAKLLTTELFKRQTPETKLSRAQALREASLAVMQQSAGKSYSYAHPMFWAPFVVFGDGG